LLSRSDLTDVGRIDWAYRLTLGRAPEPNETQRASAFIAEYESTERDVLADVPKVKPAAPKAAPAPVAVASANATADGRRRPTL